MWFFVIIAIMNRKNEKKCNYCKSFTLIIISSHKIVPCKLLLFVSYNKWLFYLLSELILIFEETFSWSFSFKSCLHTNQCNIQIRIVYAHCFDWKCIYIYTISGEIILWGKILLSIHNEVNDITLKWFKNDMIQTRWSLHNR